eukprot:TRINITY_DN10707_c0_g1_i1.p4 TRINITY_DN10707_c0_g1~~TRINITY_DN10707_c0_g1_i1.p4  ORF type:complete len:88 (-),score=1.00 TRINITY_DN10707_c0_g1_i1:36-299(-)
MPNRIGRTTDAMKSGECRRWMASISSPGSAMACRETIDRPSRPPPMRIELRLAEWVATSSASPIPAIATNMQANTVTVAKPCRAAGA